MGIIAGHSLGGGRQLAVEMVGQAISFDLSRNAVPVVIANATSAGDFDLKVAEAYMNELGAKGKTWRPRSRPFSKATLVPTTWRIRHLRVPSGSRRSAGRWRVKLGTTGHLGEGAGDS